MVLILRNEGRKLENSKNIPRGTGENQQLTLIVYTKLMCSSIRVRTMSDRAYNLSSDKEGITMQLIHLSLSRFLEIFTTTCMGSPRVASESYLLKNDVIFINPSYHTSVEKLRKQFFLI